MPTARKKTADKPAVTAKGDNDVVAAERKQAEIVEVAKEKQADRDPVDVKKPSSTAKQLVVEATGDGLVVSIGASKVTVTGQDLVFLQRQVTKAAGSL